MTINKVLTSMVPKKSNTISDKAPIEAYTICHVCYRTFPVSLIHLHLQSYHEFLNNPIKSNLFSKNGIEVTKYTSKINIF